MSNDDSYKINACVGDTRINFGEWYTPVGKTPSEFTYCEFCIKNGCVADMSTVYKVVEEVNSCNCDCENKASHEHIKPYVCQACDVLLRQGMVMDCRVGRCKKCNAYTSSGGVKYCKGCSAIFGLCPYC